MAKYEIDEELRDNHNTIDSILMVIRNLKQADATDIRLHITSYPSLDFSDEYNETLTTNRTYALMDYLRKFTIADDVQFLAGDNTFDWQYLIELIDKSTCPQKDEAINIIRNTPTKNSTKENVRKEMLMKLGNGATYNYLRKHVLSELSGSMLTITASMQNTKKTHLSESATPVTPPTQATYEPADIWLFPRRGVVALRTNGLYDIAAVPNAGIDAYVTDNISIGLNGMFAWWNNDKANKCWRIYGGDIHADYWFDSTTLWKGHHVGAFAEIFSFDMCWNDKGRQSINSIIGGGLSYGYAMPIASQLCLDFNVGIGYLGGDYYVYVPSERHPSVYYSIDKKHRNWFGPAKAEISLIWKIGKEK